MSYSTYPQELVTLMPEGPPPREPHRPLALIRRRDDLGGAHGAAGLDPRAHAGVGEDVEAVAEGEERIRRGVGAGGRHGRLHHRELRGVDAAHLARADADRLRLG